MKSHLAIATAVLCLCLSACSISAMQDTFSAAQGSFAKTVQVGDGPVSLDAMTASGDITVRHGSDREVHVIGHVHVCTAWWTVHVSPREALARLQQNPPVEQQGNSIRVGYITDPELTHQIGITYEIEVPAATQAVVRISSGSVYVDSINGPVEASTSSGHVTVTTVKSAVQASSSSGGVDLRSIGGAATIEVSSGPISGSDLAAVSAKDTSGAITLHQVRGPCEAFASSGSINVDGAPIGPWHLQTQAGPVSIHVTDSQHFELRAQVQSGGIHNSLPLTSTGTASNNFLVGSVGGGGPLVELSAQSGSISID